MSDSTVPDTLSVVRSIGVAGMRRPLKDPAFDRALGVFRSVYESESARGRVHAVDREDLRIVHEESVCEALVAALAEWDVGR